MNPLTDQTLVCVSHQGERNPPISQPSLLFEIEVAKLSVWDSRCSDHGEEERSEEMQSQILAIRDLGIQGQLRREWSFQPTTMPSGSQHVFLICNFVFNKNTFKKFMLGKQPFLDP